MPFADYILLLRFIIKVLRIKIRYNMNKRIMIFPSLLAIGAGTVALADYRGDFNHDGKFTIADVAALIETLGNSEILEKSAELADVNADGLCNTADVTALADLVLGLGTPQEMPVADPFDDTIIVTFDGATASITPLPLDGSITATISGADVVINNTITDREITTILRGNSTAGSLVYNGDYKTTIVLDGLSLKGSTAEAVNIKCGKRIALTLNDGTTNVLADATTDGGQKAALYTKGHLEVSGGGALNLTGNVKHGLSSKEYLQLKKTVGSITVTSAAADGIHAGQYFQQNGGVVNIAQIGGDGIQAEATGEEGDELDGQMIIKGGTLNIQTTATDVSALKSDSLMTISGGTFVLSTSGAGNKAIKSKQELNVSGGDFTITQSGKAIVEAGDLGYVTALKGSDVSITGGNFTINTTGAGARGIKAENLVVDAAANISITNDGAAGTASDAIEVTVDSSSDNGEADVTKSYKVYVSVPSTTSGGNQRPGQTTSNPWSTVYLYKQDGTQVATLTQQVTVNNTLFYVYDFTSSNSGTYYFGAPNYSASSSRPGGSSTTYTIKSATFTGPTSGKDVYYAISSSYSTSGTTRTYSLSNVTTQYEGGTVGSTSTSDSFTAKGLKIDGTAQLLGGTINIKMSGAGGKGIKVESDYVQGREDGSGPTLTVATTGSKYNGSGSSSGGNTGGWGGPGGEDSGGSSAKAIKVTGTVALNGGTSEISTTSDGAEGLESKVKALGSITVKGGQHYFHCYDDCINSAGGINFEGGTCVCYAYGNDAVDSNYGQSGAIVLSDGNLLTYSTKGSPEEGLDCDNNSYIRITGTGNVVALGGAQGGGSSSGIGSATQGYVLSTSSISLQSGRYYTLADASGTNLFTFSVEAAFSSSMSLFTATGMKSGSQYTLKYATSAPTSATTVFHGFFLGSSAQGTTSVTSFTAK